MDYNLAGSTLALGERFLLQDKEDKKFTSSASDWQACNKLNTQITVCAEKKPYGTHKCRVRMLQVMASSSFFHPNICTRAEDGDGTDCVWSALPPTFVAHNEANGIQALKYIDRLITVPYPQSKGCHQRDSWKYVFISIVLYT